MADTLSPSTAPARTPSPPQPRAPETRVPETRVPERRRLPEPPAAGACSGEAGGQPGGVAWV